MAGFSRNGWQFSPGIGGSFHRNAWQFSPGIHSNRKKGAEIGSRKHPEGEFIPLFNPRIAAWRDHFELNWAIIRGKTEIGEITVKILGLNDKFRVTFREYLMLIGAYPEP